ncbi:MAG TPA: DUF2934 domain-containing protein [Crenotrichaceae bacterium]|nr:DUF2934 domain-containing protein [Crenotrichaceae bacterium]
MVSKKKDVQKKGKENDVDQEKSSVQSEDNEDDQIIIAEAAYYIAEKRGFAPDHEMDDWLEAEKEVAGKTAKA